MHRHAVTAYFDKCMFAAFGLCTWRCGLPHHAKNHVKAAQVNITQTQPHTQQSICNVQKYKCKYNTWNITNYVGGINPSLHGSSNAIGSRMRWVLVTFLSSRFQDMKWSLHKQTMPLCELLPHCCQWTFYTNATIAKYCVSLECIAHRGTKTSTHYKLYYWPFTNAP